MYLEFYGLKEQPFSLTPDPEFFFLSTGHKRALSYLTYGILLRKGFMQLTGEVGSGKTMILRRLLQDIGEDAVSAYVLNPSDTFDGLLRFILKDLGVELHNSEDMSKTELLDAMYNFLLARAEEGTPVVLIFDEAQNIPLDVLEEVRMISNFETTKEKLIQIIFVGQPELREILAKQELRQLAQRITIRHHLEPLSYPELCDYIDFRIQVAGGTNVRFTSLAKEVVFNYTNGTPRLVNALCDYVLLTGFVNETFVLNHRIVEEAIAELEGRAKPKDDDRSYTAPSVRGTPRRASAARRSQRIRRVVAAGQQEDPADLQRMVQEYSQKKTEERTPGPTNTPRDEQPAKVTVVDSTTEAEPPATVEATPPPEKRRWWQFWRRSAFGAVDGIIFGDSDPISPKGF